MPWRAGGQHGWPRCGRARYANGGSRKTRGSLSWPVPNGGPACCGRTATLDGSGTEEGGGRGGFHPPWFPGAGDLDLSILSGGFRPRGRWHRNGSVVDRGRAVRELFQRRPTPTSGREVCARGDLMGARWNTEARAQAAVRGPTVILRETGARVGVSGRRRCAPQGRRDTVPAPRLATFSAWRGSGADGGDPNSAVVAQACLPMVSWRRVDR